MKNGIPNFLEYYIIKLKVQPSKLVNIALILVFGYFFWLGGGLIGFDFDDKSSARIGAIMGFAIYSIFIMAWSILNYQKNKTQPHN
ncbi:MAG: hypothetical protein ABJH98_18045 [Reichenbachiella sp.]|uniref:hypothetical protein n=1 Tax=Reichenbachiella sp. TaxID=2184521 RepID=UPI0032998433